jgi:hypothetical protein
VVAAYFLDSSALVKRYVAEIGTAWIRRITEPLASAQRIQPAFGRATTAVLTFLAADDGLLSVANAEGLLTDNPNRHP